MEIPKHYSLHSEDDSHFTIHDGRDGKTFKIAKKSIHPAHQLKIMKMQKFAGGGEAQAPGSGDWVQDFFGTPGKAVEKLYHNYSDMMTKAGQLQSSQSTPQPNSVPDQAQASSDQAKPQATQNQAPPSAAPQVANADPMAGTPYGKIFAGLEGANTGLAKQQEQAGKESASAIQANMDQMRDFNYQSQQEQWNKKVELDNLHEQLMNEKIDPVRLYHDKGTASKIGTALALVLGGIGSGLTKGPNQAMQMIDNLMAKDLEAQKANQANKMNLYSLNLKRYGDQMLADQATRLQMNTGLQSQLQLIAAKSNSASAKFIAQQMNNQLELQKANLQNQWGVAAARNKMLGLASGEGGTPISQENPMMYQGPEGEKMLAKRVRVGDTAYQANSEKEAEELRTMTALHEPIIKEINFLRSAGPQALYDPKLRAAVEGSASRLNMAINEFNGYKRFTDVDAREIEKQVTSPASLKSLLSGDENNIHTIKMLNDKLESERRQKLTNYTKGSSNTFTPSTMDKLPLNKAK